MQELRHLPMIGKPVGPGGRLLVTLLKYLTMKHTTNTMITAARGSIFDAVVVVSFLKYPSAMVYT